MSIQEQDWQIERERLQAVRDRIEEQIGRLEKDESELHADVVGIRTDFWEEIRVNTSNFDEIVESGANIRQQTEALTQHERSLEQARTTLRKLKKSRYTPYFARIDFTESGEPAEEQIYIGIGSLVNEETNEIIVYDWRAPISSMFYDYTPGPAQYDTPDGNIAGEMTLKRQYLIKQGHLDNMFDTGIQIGDEMLQYMLAKSSADKMGSIVTTIQQEQNRIIRDDQHRILIVQGAAGGGKTSVALQRVAYLLYKYRNSLSADNMVLFSPNSLFNDYVSNVLPELGEANMQQTTFQKHLDREIEERLTLEDAYDQLEYLLTKREDDPEYQARVSGIEWKTSLAFLELLDRYVGVLKKEGVLFHPFELKGRVLISSEQMEELFYQEYGTDSWIESRIERMQEWILAELDSREQILFNNLFRKLKKNPRYMGSDEEMKEESRRKAQRAFAPLKHVARKLEFVDVMGLYTRLFTEPEWLDKACDGASGRPERYEAIGKYTVGKLEAGEIPYEDAAPYVYLKAAFTGKLAFNPIKHVTIDEAQDYSPFQLEYIRRLFPRARFTMLGDLNQGIYHANVQSYNMIEELFGEENVGVIRLTKSYRSTGEIVEFTKNILLNPEPVEAIRSSGEPPKLTAVPHPGNLAPEVASGIEQLAQEGAVSIAVICKTEAETKEAHEDLSQLLDRELHLITKKTKSYKHGVVVIPAYLAKGLEFDGVIVYNASRDVYNRDSERKLLYTACTRALHQLRVYYSGELTPFLEK